ncbi:DUF3618 domain-containing protein [Mycoplana dimorpha]|uniref:Uncharacterized protein DUF3618 n=1 Tax=Mycoplana dimorpha TaxID=28320 RepID=A0A2T5B806_MYCDI|nr:DUF3618 domain-containing protein [Mycoplana dimorpha]PTM95126.1 uncharacterized protein DUF3618 [Mycoplana dimorpha]
MKHDQDHRTAAELQSEIEADRERIEEKLHAIQERMSPGQVVDELIEYAKNSGGAEYVSNLGTALKTNPLPVALMGISLAWLMAKSGSASNGSGGRTEREEYPLARVTGAVRRTEPVQDQFGERYSHFSDERGNRFRALTDKAGRRAGHFIDEAGRTYRGFADAAGNQIQDIRDEAGTLFDEASGWISQSWSQITESAARVQSAISDAGRSVGEKSAAAGNAISNQTANLNQALLTQFREQPLVGGALAFAVGAAIGSALPNTEQEDEIMGEPADALREAVADRASDAMHKVGETAADLYGRATAVASDVHDAAKERIAEEARDYKG